MVWHGSPDEGDSDRATTAWVFSLAAVAASTRLDPTDRDLVDKGSRTGVDADRFLARRAILRRLAARWCGVAPVSIVIGYDQAGAPRIIAPVIPLFCSVAARGGLTALALAPEPVGIDVEPIEAGDIPFAMLSTGEAALLRGMQPAERLHAFLEIWTVKEAHTKAAGTGLQRDPADISVSFGSRTVADGADAHWLPDSAWHSGTTAGRRFIAACVTRPR